MTEVMQHSGLWVPSCQCSMEHGKASWQLSGRQTQVLESLRSDARAADQAHSEAVAAARAGEAQLWRQRLQQAESAAQQQVPLSSPKSQIGQPLEKSVKHGGRRCCELVTHAAISEGHEKS